MNKCDISVILEIYPHPFTKKELSKGNTGSVEFTKHIAGLSSTRPSKPENTQKMDRHLYAKQNLGK